VNGITSNINQVIAGFIGVGLKVEAADEVVEEVAAHTVAGIAARLAPKLTGALQASVDEEGGRVVVDAPYGAYQEFGTRHNKAQPFLRPAKALSEPIVKRTAEGIYTTASR
jgi:HK97 gp10 family phage protein